MTSTPENKADFIEASQTLAIRQPDRVDSKIITIHEWSAIKSKINEMRGERNYFCWKDLGMLFLGIGATTFISMIVAGFSVFAKMELISLVILCVFFLLCGILFVIIDFQFKKKNGKSYENIINTMELIEKNRF